MFKYEDLCLISSTQAKSLKRLCILVSCLFCQLYVKAGAIWEKEHSIEKIAP